LLLFIYRGIKLEENKKVNKFISEWEITTSGEAIELPLHKCGRYNFTVDWGDNTTNKIKNYEGEKKFHKYKSPGIYTIQLTGRIDCLSFENNFSNPLSECQPDAIRN